MRRFGEERKDRTGDRELASNFHSGFLWWTISIDSRVPRGQWGGYHDHERPEHVLALCRSKCPKNFDRTTPPASSHRTNPSVALHTLKYSLVPSHESISSIARTSCSSRAYTNHIVRTGSCTSAPNIARRTHLLLIARPL